jgi:phage tail-like protein
MDTIPGFHFSVEFALLPTLDKDMRFQEVSGLEGAIEYETIREGGNNTEVISIPKPTSFGTISFKRSLTKSSVFIYWIEAAMYLFKFVPVDLLVSLRDQNSNPTMAWFIAGAVPEKWSTSGIDANKSELVIESLDIKFKYFRRMTNKMSSLPNPFS